MLATRRSSQRRSKTELGMDFMPLVTSQGDTVSYAVGNSYIKKRSETTMWWMNFLIQKHSVKKKTSNNTMKDNLHLFCVSAYRLAHATLSDYSRSTRSRATRGSHFAKSAVIYRSRLGCCKWPYKRHHLSLAFIKAAPFLCFSLRWRDLCACLPAWHRRVRTAWHQDLLKTSPNFIQSYKWWKNKKKLHLQWVIC